MMRNGFELGNGERFLPAMLVVLGLLLGFVGPLWAADPALMVKADSERRTTLADLPLPLQYTISGQFGRDDPAYHFAANTAAPQAANPQQGLTARFNPAGLRVQAGDIDWNLTLTGWGRGEALIAPTDDAAPVRHANRVEYVHGALTAWYVNGPMGLQQGWTVQERPAGEGDLTLTLHSQGLVAQVEANGRSLKLSDDHGAPRLHYGGLLAVDATGREIPVRFIVEGEQVRVAVNDAGATYPLIIDPWIQLAWLTSSDGSSDSYNSLLGSSVAMNDDGSVVVAGAPRPLFPAPSSPGAVYVFNRPTGGWNNGLDAINETQWLTASDGVAGDEFGASVAISADGSTIVVGAPNQYPGGAAYVFENEGSWGQSAKLTASDAEYGDLFGDSVAVAVSSDGDTVVVVGAPANNAIDPASGAAYVFVAPQSLWSDATQDAKLQSHVNGGADGDLLGSSVAISANGNTIVAGAPSYGIGGKPGAAYVFFNPDTWTGTLEEDAILTASDGENGDLLGSSVDISANSSVIVAGAPKVLTIGEDGNAITGAVYVFTDSGDGWVGAKLTANDGMDGDELGRAVAISADGKIIVAGAPDRGNGATYVFGNSSGTWTEDAILTALYGGNGYNQQLGRAVAIADDGTIAAGARFNDFGRGAVFMFGAPVPAKVLSITAIDSPTPPHLTSASHVWWRVTFDRPVSGLTTSNFKLALAEGGSINGASIDGVVDHQYNYGNVDTVWNVWASTGTGTGTLGLNMFNDTGLSPPVTPPPTDIKPIVGEAYTKPATVAIDPPSGTSTTTSATSVSWTVTFSQAVKGLTESNFTFVAAGVTGASLTSVTGADETWTVTANTGSSGNGTLDLSMDNVAGVLDGSNVALNVTGLPVVGGTYTINRTAPTATVISIATSLPTTTAATSVSWTVTFSASVMGVATGNFALVGTGVSGASITSVSGSGATRTVTANTGSGNGTLGLNMTGSSGITPAISNLPFTGAVYTINKPTPTVTAITRARGNPTSLASVDWIVTLSQPVTGVTTGNFTLVPGSGITGTSLTGITGSGDTWTVTASTGTGNGTLGLNMTSSGSITPPVNVPPTFTGQVYTITGPSSIFATTWSGSQFVAVGAGGLIRTSADGSTWVTQTSGTTDDLYGIAWSGQLFVAVGDNGTLLTSPNGVTWATRTSGTTQPLFGVAWSGGRFMVVGGAGTVLISTDGITWTLQVAGTANSLFSVSWSGSGFTALGDNNTVLPFPRPWGDDKPLPSAVWAMIGLPAKPAAPGTVDSVFSASQLGTYETDWTVWRRDTATDQYLPLALTDPLTPGIGYWIQKDSPGSVNLTVAGSATPVVTTNRNCPSLAGCYEISLVPPAGGSYRFNLIAMPLPYPVGWWEARLQVTTPANQTTLYTLDAAQTYVQGNYWVWNGNDYAVYDSVTPGMVGLLQPWQGVWLKVYAASQGHTLKLLIPSTPKYSRTPPAAPVVAQRSTPDEGGIRWLDWLIAPAAAEPVAPTLGLAEREVNRDANSQALQEGRAWYVRLIAEEPTVPMQTRNSVLGQLPDSVEGYDTHDLPKLPPFGAPYLSIAFPHPDWGKNAGDYASDYRSNHATGGYGPNRTTTAGPAKTPGLPPATWRFEVRTDRAGYAVQLRWEGPPDLLGRMELVDNDTGRRYPAGNPGYVRNGIPVTMTAPVRHFTWVFAGQPAP